MQDKVAVLGDADFVMPFSALGLDTFSVGERIDQMRESARRIISERYALVVVAENIAEKVEEIFKTQMNLPTPCIVAVPFTTESKGFATKALGEALRMATGIDILQGG